MNTDSGLLAPGWAASGAAAEVSDEAWLRTMLEVEAALARAQAKLGLVPAAAAEAVTGAAAADLDVTSLARHAREAANPVVALVAAFAAVIGPDAAEYLHRGCTSQDVLDSAAMTLAARTLRRIGDDLDRVAVALAGLAEEHRGTVQAGRTLTQHAVPTTFGLKAAGWLVLVTDALARVRGLVLPVQLGGAAGTLAAYQEYANQDLPGTDAVELVGAVAAELGLAEPPVPWHTLRTPIADLAGVLQFVTGALGKFAVDVQNLGRTEVGEVSEPVVAGRGASSAMPQKRNPVLATLIVSAARQVPALALVLNQSMLAEDERPAGAWHAEWQPLREALRLTGGAAEIAAELAEGLVVHPERMMTNLRLTDGALLTERINVALAPVLGKAEAKRMLARDAAAGVPVRATLARIPGLAGRIDDLLDPTRYVGAADRLVDRALAYYHEKATKTKRP